MEIHGEFRKMPAAFGPENLVQYRLRLFDTESGEVQEVPLNRLLGQHLSIRFEGNIFCKRCGRKTSKSFGQGFCFPCFQSAPEAAPCIIRPELCRAHLGEGRDPEWEQTHHNRPHYVYLAASDVVKVGVTRATQIPTRWIDQGAGSAIKLAQTPNRYQAGLIEVALKAEFTDKTNWRKMLTNQTDETIDLEETKWRLEELLPRDMAFYVTDEDDLTVIRYPVLSYPDKVKSISLDKTPEVGGRLTGIKGQYLLFEGGGVMNIRKHTGYQVSFKASA